MSDNLLSFKDVRKDYGDRVVLDHVTLGMDAGVRIGLIGTNGSGKSTLLKIIAGQETADGGTVATRAGLKVAFLEQVPHLTPGRTAREVIAEPLAPLIERLEAYQRAAAALDPAADRLAAEIEQLGGWDWEHRVERAATEAGVADLDASVDHLSGGEGKRVALARLVLEGADLVLMDEPTNHLDADTVEWLEGWVVSSGAAALIVTHDRYFLDAAVDRIAEVRDGALRIYDGAYTDYLIQRALEEEHSARVRQREMQVIKTELEWARRSPKARTTKNKARLKQLDARQTDLGDGQGEVRELGDVRFSAPPRLGKTILELTHVAKRYEGGPPLIDDLTLILRRGERFGIIGPNGCGKTTLLRLIEGSEAADSGSVKLGANTQIAYFDQHRTVLDLDASVRQTITPRGGDHVFPGGGDKIHAVTWLARFAFPKSMHGQKVGALSGGERNRLAIARFLLEEANVLLLDEPTNDLDLLTLSVLEQALLAFKGCVLTVSHDRYFLDRIATAMIAFERDETAAPGQVTVVQGDWTHYRRVRLKEIDAARASKAKAEAEARKAAREAPAARPKVKKKGLSYAEERELEGIEPAVEAAEERVAALEAQVAEPGLWSDGPARGLALQAELDAARAESERLMGRWEDLMTRSEG